MSHFLAAERVNSWALRTGGNLGDHKSVGEGVWEARLPFGPGYRIYFGKDGAAMILLLVGGDKATQKKDIQRARRYWAEYSEEENDGEA